ncbi:hypothetical protein AXG93_1670s1140 [Marchantia polymorpha subsp. ruderalis]|uniref:Uncharacterized protein n=1 Tax=Marchantia polymorpha subsp. ruderalis TaxID=1480154 RepID=A0A176WH73_MARPO|nr:hypothetical protein AXG93_1670s1140 [Marchantia polymorpha subsp. ruderalis]
MFRWIEDDAVNIFSSQDVACGDGKSACARDVLAFEASAFGGSAFGGGAFSAKTLREHPYALEQGGRRQDCEYTCAFCGRSERADFGGTGVGGLSTAN